MRPRDGTLSHCETSASREYSRLLSLMRRIVRNEETVFGDRITTCLVYVVQDWQVETMPVSSRQMFPFATQKVSRKVSPEIDN
jgi:hypothetical protein